MRWLNNFLGYISNTKLFGWIPLDILAHLFFGYIIVYACRRVGLKVLETFVILMIFALLKEYKDSFNLGGSSLFEHTKDIIITLLPLYASFYLFKTKTVKTSPK